MQDMWVYSHDGPIILPEPEPEELSSVESVLFEPRMSHKTFLSQLDLQDAATKIPTVLSGRLAMQKADTMKARKMRENEEKLHSSNSSV
eukprot:3126515-Pyramimonas_sp.AAC.1